MYTCLCFELLKNYKRFNIDYFKCIIIIIHRLLDIYLLINAKLLLTFTH